MGETRGLEGRADPEARRRRPSQRGEDEPHISGLCGIICDIVKMLQLYLQRLAFRKRRRGARCQRLLNSSRDTSDVGFVVAR